jgi:hypothetical protein
MGVTAKGLLTCGPLVHLVGVSLLRLRRLEPARRRSVRFGSWPSPPLTWPSTSRAPLLAGAAVVVTWAAGDDATDWCCPPVGP